jgi:hypothetical protein
MVEIRQKLSWILQDNKTVEIITYRKKCKEHVDEIGGRRLYGIENLQEEKEEEDK